MYRTLRTGFLFSGIHCFCNTIQTLPNLEIFQEKRCTNSRVTFIIHTNIIFLLLRKVCHIKFNITTISKSSEKSTPSDQGLHLRSVLLTPNCFDSCADLFNAIFSFFVDQFYAVSEVNILLSTNIYVIQLHVKKREISHGYSLCYIYPFTGINTEYVHCLLKPGSSLIKNRSFLLFIVLQPRK